MTDDDRVGVSAASTTLALDVRGVSKAFRGNPVLVSVDLRVRPGEVHALVGGNGSGKSTLIKILSGFHVPQDGGEAVVWGERLQFGSPEHSYHLGCRFVHQDLGLVESVSVLDNVLLGTFPTRLATIRGRVAAAKCGEILEQVGLDVSPRANVSQLGPVQRTGVAIARALRPDASHPARVLVLDEPTATLPVDEVERLFVMLRRAASRGVATLFVTHHLAEVYRVADLVTILRDGRVVGRSPITDVEHDDLVELIAGARVDKVQRERAPTKTVTVKPSLLVEDLRDDVLGGVALAASAGEVVGIAGLTGSGREEVLGAIFGAAIGVRGRVFVNGKPVPAERPDLAMAAGMAFLPADRKVGGGVMTLSARENLTLADLGPFWSKLRLSRRAETREAAKWFAQLGVKPADGTEQELREFSGGNQQKILIAKWARRKPAVLLLDEPTQGVDVAAKSEIHRHLLGMAHTDTILLVSSTDTDELVTLCTRVLVMRNGTVADELIGDLVTETAIVRSMTLDRTNTSSEPKENT